MGTKSRFYVDIMDLHSEVTGSCHLCVVRFPNDERVKFIVDCGLFQEKDANIHNEKFTFKEDDVSFCLITHNHVDHIGRLPLLVKKGFYGPIYATETTSVLMPAALYDCSSVLRGNSKTTGLKPIYDDDDVGKALDFVKPCEYDETITVSENIKVNFFKNCHLPGAAMILVRISYPENEDINLLFTGDYNSQNIFLGEVDLKDKKWLLDLPLTIVQESTYGDSNSSEIDYCFDRNILKTIEEGGTVLAPVFSLGRSQEILYRLKSLQDAGKLNVNVPIYLDGKLTFKYTKLYSKGCLDIEEAMIDFLPQNLTFVDKPIRNMLINESRESKIILTSSGMGSYGPARTYIPAFLGRKNYLIHFTGYTAEGTLGRRIKETPAGEIVEVAGMVIKKKAKVEYTSEFSAHARADTMIDFLKQFTNLKLVLINHGNFDVKETFAKRVFEEVDPKNVGILSRETLFRVNTWGLVKTIPTKFI